MRGDSNKQLNYPGPHKLEIRNRHLHSYLAQTAGGFNPNNYTLQFISLTETGEYDVHDIAYTYDSLSRLQQADYNNGGMVYDYDYDVAGNLVNNNGITRTYNAVNQLTNDGTNNLSYDRNGNLTGDGVNSYVWDRANRLLSVGNTSYKYDGLSNRIQQTVNSIVTNYLNDVQPGLTKLLRQDDGTNIKHFVHAPRGIHAVDDGTSWNYYLQDGLGSMRNDGLSYSPVGVPGAAVDDFGFTGEYTNGELLYLRARNMSPNMGTFLSLDPFEGMMDSPMSLNGYSWVEGNTPNMVDPNGMSATLAQLLNAGVCLSAGSPCIVVCLVGPFGCLYFCENGPQLIPPSGPITDPNEDLAEAIEDFFERLFENVFGGSNEDVIISEYPASVESQTDVDANIQTRTDRRRLAQCRIPEGDNEQTLGVFIHRLIQVFFQHQLGRQHTDVERPLIEGAGVEGGPGRPDAVLYPSGNPTTNSTVEIYEIKPISQGPNTAWYESGKEQLRRYVRNWNYNTGGKGIYFAREGTYWNPNGYFMTYPYDITQDLVLYTYYGRAPGMIYYGCRNSVED